MILYWDRGQKVQELYLPSIKIHFQDSAIFLAKVDLPTPYNKNTNKMLYLVIHNEFENFIINKGIILGQ